MTGLGVCLSGGQYLVSLFRPGAVGLVFREEIAMRVQSQKVVVILMNERRSNFASGGSKSKRGAVNE